MSPLLVEDLYTPGGWNACALLATNELRSWPGTGPMRYAGMASLVSLLCAYCQCMPSVLQPRFLLLLCAATPAASPALVQHLAAPPCGGHPTSLTTVPSSC